MLAAIAIYTYVHSSDRTVEQQVTVNLTRSTALNRVCGNHPPTQLTEKMAEECKAYQEDLIAHEFMRHGSNCRGCGKAISIHDHRPVSGKVTSHVFVQIFPFMLSHLHRNL